MCLSPAVGGKVRPKKIIKTGDISLRRRGGVDRKVPVRLEESVRQTKQSARVKEEKQVDHFPACARG